MSHPSVAAPILDLCNYLTREGRVPQHPASTRKHEVLTLLGDLVQRLEKLAENEETEPAALRGPRTQVDDGVSLIVALCDACALVGDKEAVGKLHQAFELKHRRVRTEAAAALARLGEADGEKSLVALARGTGMPTQGARIRRGVGTAGSSRCGTPDPLCPRRSRSGALAGAAFTGRDSSRATGTGRRAASVLARLR